MNSQHFTQYEFEQAIYRTLEHGDEVEIAKILGVSPGLISQYLSPTDERESPLFKAAAILSAMLETNTVGGCKALNLFTTYCKRSLPDKELCVEKTRRNRFKERMDADLAEAEGKSLDEQIEELEQERDAVDSLITAKRRLRNAHALVNNGAGK